MKHFTFIIILLTSIGSTSSVKFWDDYAPFSTRKDFVVRLGEEAKNAGFSSVYEYQPYVCYIFREYVDSKNNEFTESLNEMLKKHSVSEWFMELVTSNKENKFFDSYKQLIVRSYSYFFEKLTPEDALLNEPNELADDLQKPITSRWIDRAYKKIFEDGKIQTDFLRREFDHFDIGQFYARLLFYKDFSCYDVPEMSLIIFKMFYFRVFEEKYLGDFFRGFFGVLKEAKDSDAAVLFQTNTVNSFFGYNVLVLLGMKSSYADQLLTVFNTDPDRESVMIDNFVIMYSTVLRTVEAAERTRAKEKDDFLKDLVSLKERALEKFGRKLTFFTLKYVQALLMGAALGPVGTLGAVVVHEVFDSELHKLSNAIKNIVDPEDTSGDQMNVMIEGAPSEITLDNLRNFLGYFEDQIKTHKNCIFCLYHLKNFKIELEKVNSGDSKKDLLLI